METFKLLYLVACFLLIIGGINWGMIAYNGTNLVEKYIRNVQFVRGLYLLIGVAALILLYKKGMYLIQGEYY